MIKLCLSVCLSDILWKGGNCEPPRLEWITSFLLSLRNTCKRGYNIFFIEYIFMMAIKWKASISTFQSWHQLWHSKPKRIPRLLTTQPKNRKKSQRCHWTVPRPQNTCYIDICWNKVIISILVYFSVINWKPHPR